MSFDGENRPNIYLNGNAILIQEAACQFGWSSLNVAKAQLLFFHLREKDDYSEIPDHTIAIAAVYLALTIYNGNADMKVCMAAILGQPDCYPSILEPSEDNQAQCDVICEEASRVINTSQNLLTCQTALEYGVHYLAAMKSTLPIDYSISISNLAYKLMCSSYLTSLCKLYEAPAIGLACCTIAAKQYTFDWMEDNMWREEVNKNVDPLKFKELQNKIMEFWFMMQKNENAAKS